MPEDISSLFTVSIYVEAMLGLLLLHTWVQQFEIRAVAFWGGAHLLRAASITLFGTFGRLPEVVTVDLANAMLLASFAVTWAGARLFSGRKIHLLGILAGPVIWLIAARVPQIADSVPIGALVSSAIIATYVWLAAAEVWCINEDQLISRLPAFFMLFAQGALFLMRTPLGALMPHTAGTEPLFGSIWLTVLSSQALLFTIAVAFILMAMAKERAARMQRAGKSPALPLGVADRQGLISRIMG